jgi:hypothetical protein
MDYDTIMYKLRKYQTKLESGSGDLAIYQKKIEYYNMIGGAGSVSPLFILNGTFLRHNRTSEIGFKYTYIDNIEYILVNPLTVEIASATDLEKEYNSNTTDLSIPIQNFKILAAKNNILISTQEPGKIQVVLSNEKDKYWVLKSPIAQTINNINVKKINDATQYLQEKTSLLRQTAHGFGSAPVLSSQTASSGVVTGRAVASAPGLTRGNSTGNSGVRARAPSFRGNTALYYLDTNTYENPKPAYAAVSDIVYGANLSPVSNEKPPALPSSPEERNRKLHDTSNQYGFTNYGIPLEITENYKDKDKDNATKCKQWETAYEKNQTIPNPCYNQICWSINNNLTKSDPSKKCTHEYYGKFR